MPRVRTQRVEMVLRLAPVMPCDEDFNGCAFIAGVGHAGLSRGTFAPGGGGHAPAAVRVVAS